MEFCESKTKINLMRAFAGESMARNRYTFAAMQAKAQNFQAIEKIFLYTAGQEEQHAKIFFERLQKNGCGENVEIAGGYPVDGGDIITLLEQARHNEQEEYGNIYPEFAKTAEEEGFVSVAKHFALIAEIEATHGFRFGSVAQMLKSDTFYSSPQKTKWVCLNCGHVFEGKFLPEECPVCSHPKGFFIHENLAPYCAK